MTTRSRTSRTRPASKPNDLHSIELFTGAGGLALATHEAGFQHRALIEWNRDACDTVRENVKAGSVKGIGDWNVIEADIREVPLREFGDLDLIAGGPPCQPFSIGGKHRGVEDRRDMIPEFIRSVRELAPRAFIMENVKGLTRKTFANYFSYTKLQLTYPSVLRKPRETWQRHLDRLEDIHTRGKHGDLRYNVVARLLNAADYGVPQVRERVFFVGFRSDLGLEWHFPEPTHTEDALIHDQWITGEYWKRHGVRRPVSQPPRLQNRLHRLGLFAPATPLPWRTVRDAIADLPEPRADRDSQGVLNHRLQLGARAYVGHTGSPLDGPSKTLKAGVHGVPGGENMIAFPDGSVRYLTVREAARVQTFPDGWRFYGAWSEVMRQLGNAVPMHLASVVATSVANKLRERDARG